MIVVTSLWRSKGFEFLHLFASTCDKLQLQKSQPSLCSREWALWFLSDCNAEYFQNTSCWNYKLLLHLEPHRFQGTLNLQGLPGSSSDGWSIVPFKMHGLFNLPEWPCFPSPTNKESLSSVLFWTSVAETALFAEPETPVRGSAFQITATSSIFDTLALS